MVDVTDRQELADRAAHVCFGRVAEVTADPHWSVNIPATTSH